MPQQQIAASSSTFRPVAGKRLELRVTVTPRSPYTLADYGTFTLTVREDPAWPRATAAQRAAAASADPIADGWETAITPIVGTVAGSVVTFVGTAPTGPGYDRYAYDVTAAGGAAGAVSVVDVTWLTVLPTNVE
jgi:hypothetical protein